MTETFPFLIALGGILLLGLATDVLGKRTALPRVTLLLLFGVAIGPESLDLIPTLFTERFELVTQMALLMVGFLLGGQLTRETFRECGTQVLVISITTALVTMLCVLLGLYATDTGLGVIILLACISTATAPAAAVDIVLETQDRSPFSRLLLSIVAVDDAWGLVLFSIGLAVVSGINGIQQEHSAMAFILQDIGGAMLLGLLLGLPAAYLTGRIKPGQPILSEALGLVFLCGGLALWLEVSFLIAAMTMGAVIANLAHHHEYPFHAIEGIEWPILSIFFVVAGASLEISTLPSLGLLGLLYIASRSLGKLLGGWVGGMLSGAPATTRRWIGIAMLPQAGAAMGMALAASAAIPEYRQVLLSIVIGSTIIFEIIGPILTRIALDRAERKFEIDQTKSSQP